MENNSSRADCWEKSRRTARGLAHGEADGRGEKFSLKGQDKPNE